MAQSRDLSRVECENLIRAGVIGRVAIATPTGPHIIPINYSVVDDAVVVRTTPYSLLGTYGRDATLAFEIDQFDHAHQRGWSVVARGRAETVDDVEEIEQIRRTWPPRPWANGQRPLFIRLRWSELTGRRLGDGWDPMSELPARRAVL